MTNNRQNDEYRENDYVNQSDDEYNPYSQQVTYRQDPDYKPKKKYKIAWGRSLLLTIGLTVAVNLVLNFGNLFF